MVDTSSSGRPKALRGFAFTMFHNSPQGPLPYTQDFFCEKLAQLEGMSEEERSNRANEMAEKFLSAAERLASVERQPQMFGIAAYASIAPSSTAVGNCPFRVDPDQSNLVDYTETPDARGAHSQTMRGYEVSQKELTRRLDLMFTFVNQTQERMERFCDLMGRRNQHLEEGQIALIERIQVALDGSVARATAANISIMQANREERHWRLGEDAAVTYLPGLVAALRDRFGQGPMASLLKSLSPDQLKTLKDAIVAMGTSEQRDMLIAALETHRGMVITPSNGKAQNVEVTAVPTGGKSNA